MSARTIAPMVRASQTQKGTSKMDHNLFAFITDYQIMLVCVGISASLVTAWWRYL